MLMKKPVQQFDELEKRMFYGDSGALQELLRIMNGEKTSDEASEAAFDAFRSACTGYAMGIKVPPEQSEWHQFREIVKYDSLLGDYQESLAYAQGTIARMKFEETVLKILLRDNSDIDRKLVEVELQATQEGIRMVELDVVDSQKHSDFCSAWLTVARAQLHNERFTALSEDEFYELVDSVALALEETDDEDVDEDEECDEDDE